MITAIIQARMNSTRLPGKVLLPFGDTTVLGHTIRQVKKAKAIGRIIVATSDESADDLIAEQCDKLGVEMFRGDLKDVLDRYYKAATKYEAVHICRITADCPLIDPTIIDLVAKEYENGKYDYLSTGRVSSTFPDGIDTEIFSFAALKRAWEAARLPSEREHVTPYIWKHPELFRIYEFKNSEDLSKYRLTLDEPDDYIALQNILAHVPEPSMKTIIPYLAQHPEVVAINSTFRRDTGYEQSVQEDRRSI
jgi:spore coat polysaccharide biosynthesis protein SpsF